MTQFDDTEVTRLRAALRRINREMDRRVSNDGMPLTQLSVLATVAGRKKIAMSELADTEGVNPTMLSRVVGKLEGAGLVTRRNDNDDRRVIHVEVTTSGLRLHTRLRRERSKLLSASLADLGEHDIMALSAALGPLESLAAALRSPATVGAAR